MSIVNLNKARKTKTKADEKAQADQNAIVFGRTKAERVLDAANATLTNNKLSQLKFEEE
ncbi:DUF4169 family protein [bacterium]|nr:DUF4169 family protein [bacterium]